MTDYKPTPLSRITPTLWGIKFEEIIYLALIGLSLIGVAITNYAPTQSYVYWFIMIAAFASVKGTLFLRQPVNSCFHNTAALQFCKLQRRHLESEMYPRRIVRMHGAVYLRHKLT